MEATTTTPSPIERGPLIYRYFSLGAQAAVRLSPPTIPAVYMAALATSGPTGNKKNKFNKRQEKKITHGTN